MISTKLHPPDAPSSWREACACAFLLLLLAQSSAHGQFPGQWSTTDTVTTGSSDDTHPSLTHNALFYSQTSGFVRMVFERRTPTESQIVAKRYNVSGSSWDTSEVVISSSPLEEMQTRPDYADGPHGSSPTHRTRGLAVWQQRKDQRWQLFYSMLNDSQETWTRSSLLVSDSMSATDARVRPFDDSLFLVTWKRANAIIALKVSSSGISSPETLAVSSSDTIEYDICMPFPDRAWIVWTTGSPPAIMILARMNNPYAAGGWSPAETTLTHLASPPFPHLFVGFGSPSFLYEKEYPVKQDVLLCMGAFPGQQSVNISQDSSSVDVNAQAFQLPMITKPTANGIRGAYYPDVCVYEKYRETDSMLVFMSYSRADTVRSQGHNRNVCVGSQLWSDQGGLHVLVVWESNRSGRSHIYSRVATLMFDNVDEPTTPPLAFKLYPNYPNPFNLSTTIGYRVPGTGNGHEAMGNRRVRLSVYDVLGREVAVLVNEQKSAGTYTVQFDAAHLASGVYLYRLTAGLFVDTRRMMLVK